MEAPRFVVQRHNARRLHFDLRLEIDGTLASWAVPRGPSLDPADQRLAVRVGDHGLEHLHFEGRHEGARYGPGTVIVWDAGTWEDRDDDGGRPGVAGLAAGHLAIALHGTRLRGDFSLRQVALGGDPANWLLVKKRDAHAVRGRGPAETELTSVLTGLRNVDHEA